MKRFTFIPLFICSLTWAATDETNLRPTNLLPRLPSYYSLGSEEYPWKAIVVDTISFPSSGIVISGSWDGWIGADETWTYISATQFSVTGDVSGKYGVGDKVKLTQTTAKYFYVTAVAAGVGVTTVTVTGGTDYTLANASITSPFYSKMATPQSFPHWFAYTPSWTSSGSAPAIGNGTLTGRFTIEGRTVTAQIRFVVGNSSTMGTGDYFWALPVTGNTSQPVAAAAPRGAIGNWYGADSGVGDYGGIVRMNDTAAMKIDLGYPNPAASGRYTAAVGQTSPFTWGTNDNFSLEYSYEI